MDGLVEVRTALLSVANKYGLESFARELETYGIELSATGGTYSSLRAAGVQVRSLQEDFKLPQALEGRVKTLHYPLFAAILAKREGGQLAELSSIGMKPIDMVVVNFYPFEKVSAERDVTQERLIENIDIGGPSMVRAAAKNFEYVSVVTSPTLYDFVLKELRTYGGKTSREARRDLALHAFSTTASYDIGVFSGLSSHLSPDSSFPNKFFLASSLFKEAKYGENPDQRAAIYSIDGWIAMARWKQLAGDALSFNNYLDIGSAYEILDGFEDHPAAATVKHGNISGFAFAPTLEEAYSLAHACDPEADFGGTAIFNREVDGATAKLVGKNEGVEDGSVYTEIVIAPSFEPEALRLLESKQKKKVRVIQADARPNYPHDVKILQGAILVQDKVDYRRRLDAAKLTFPTARKPTDDELLKLLAAWEVVRRVQSNGIVIADGRVESGRLSHFWTLGVGTFRKRNGAVKIALDNAGERARGAVSASDGFFPFRDSVDYLGRAGVGCAIQPGGSVSDQEVIDAANEYKIAMVLTHARAFRH